MIDSSEIKAQVIELWQSGISPRDPDAMHKLLQYQWHKQLSAERMAMAEYLECNETKKREKLWIIFSRIHALRTVEMVRAMESGKGLL